MITSLATIAASSQPALIYSKRKCSGVKVSIGLIAIGGIGFPTAAFAVTILRGLVSPSTPK